MKKIYWAVIRDLWQNKSRTYIAVFSILVVIAFPIAMFSTSPSLAISIEDDSEEFKLAHLDIRFHSVSESIVEILNETIKNHTGRYPEAINSRIVSSQQITYNEEVYKSYFVGFNPNQTYHVNQINCVQGKMPTDAGEIALLESLAQEMNLRLDDSLEITKNNITYNFRVVGLVQSIEFLSFNLDNSGAIYFYEPVLREILILPEPLYNSIIIYFWDNISTNTLSEISNIIRDKVVSMHLPLVLLWQIREISVSAVFQDAISLTSKYLSASAYIIMFVAGIVIYIINKRYAFEQRKQTGTLYAFGVSSNMIYQTFMLRTLMLSLIGIGGGVGSSWFLLKLLAGTLGNRWGVLQLQLIFNTSILVKVCVIVFVVVHFFTYLAVKENVKMTPYEALRGKPTEFGKNIGKDNLLSHFGISLKYPLRNLLRNKNRSILTVFAFFGAILLSFSLIVAQNSVYETVDTYYEEQMNWDIKSYLHTYSYTESDLDFLDNNSLIENYEPYLETLVQPVDYPEILIIIRGIQPNSDLLHIDLQEGEMFSDSQPNGCILSKFIAERLNLNITDKLSLWLGSTQINLTVIGFARDMDATASMFVLLPDLEQILGHTLINGALISVADQNLPETAEYLNTIPLIESLIEKQESKDRITQLISNQTLIVQVMVILGFIISFITIFTTAFITAIERQRELSLQSVFGFSNWQLLSQLFLETFILICVAVLLGFAGGHFLAQFWLSIISEIFFKIDLYYNIHDFLISGGISLLAAGFSIYPGFKMMQKQNLASSIREE